MNFKLMTKLSNEYKVFNIVQESRTECKILKVVDINGTEYNLDKRLEEKLKDTIYAVLDSKPISNIIEQYGDFRCSIHIMDHYILLIEGQDNSVS